MKTTPVSNAENRFKADCEFIVCFPFVLTSSTPEKIFLKGHRTTKTPDASCS
jgi:hypothetical protein